MKNSIMRKIFILWSVVVLFLSCSNNLNNTHKKEIIIKSDSLIFETYFYPAFAEHSTIKLLKTNAGQNLKILIKKDYRIDKSQDTFYFKTVPVSKIQYTSIDTSIIEKVKTKYEQKVGLGLDGMTIMFKLINNKDTTLKGFWSPSKEDDLFGYKMVKAAIDNYKTIFNDSVISGYLDEVETYIDESKIKNLSKSNKPVNQLRVKKYTR